MLLTDQVPESESDLRKVLEFGAKVRKPILIVAPDFKPDALTSLVVNHLQNKVKVVAVKTPITE